MESLIPLYLLNHWFPLGNCWLKFSSPAALWMLPVPYSPPDLTSWKRYFLLACSCFSYSCLLPGFLFFSPATYLIQTWLFFSFPNHWGWDKLCPCLAHVCPPIFIHFFSWVLAQSPWLNSAGVTHPSLQSQPVAKSSDVCPSIWSFLIEMHSPRWQN